LAADKELMAFSLLTTSRISNHRTGKKIVSML
jgi:hypothetical protein